jgi:NADPH:quinone reductase-like Zn-dependent oxidoreductase
MDEREAVQVWRLHPGEGLKLEHILAPYAKQDHLVLRVLSAGLNRRDAWMLQGRYPLALGTSFVPGADVVALDPSGNRVLLNPGMNWESGENMPFSFKVLGEPGAPGGFARLIQVHRSRVHSVPEHLNAIQAAALPLAGLTAYRVLFSRARIEPGQNVLITGIGGGVAGIAAQMAVAAGCNVFVTTSTQVKIDKAKSLLGVLDGVLYGNEDWPELISAKLDATGFDVVVDGSGGDAVKDYLQLLANGGKLVIYGLTAGRMKQKRIELAPIVFRNLSIMGSTMGSDKEFKDMLEFVSKHRIVPIIDAVYDFEHLPEAMDRMLAASSFGKVCIQMNSSRL